MSTFAETTKVSSEKSRVEIERTLTRYGADQFMYGWQEDYAMVMFRMEGRHIKFLVPLPDRNSAEFAKTPTGKKRTKDATEKAFEQSVRQKWRALALVIKAKLEAVESGIAEFDNEFMANIVMPDGKTVSEHVAPNIQQAYETGEMPPLLPAPKGDK